MRYLTAFSGTQLNVALKALSSSIKMLVLHEVTCSILPEAFQGVTFANLECLSLENMFSPDWTENMAVQVSEYINGLFDNSCATPAFPKLLELTIGHERKNEDDEEDLAWFHPDWNHPPTKSIAAQCPVLKQIFIVGLTIAHDVLLYLAEFRKAGGSIGTNLSSVALFRLSSARQDFLGTLGITELTHWHTFCAREGAPEDYTDCHCFNSMSDLRFRRIAYACALKHATDVQKFKNFLDVVEADLEQSGMTLAVLASLKQILEVNEKMAEDERLSFEW